ncbi:cell division protein FtsL [Paenalkalicoccus suaedae]|uniref:Cell division protein FtsL n=1 Tax=Paenalkalicoccus suaedae TaxID=2592382 RepID=A0A859FEC0_9BACI|nr:cell division protein FtsL [Paenalkalicoccus suaedae]QKS71529.1 cell division protein FtsL [Paenalkalicoccus suaedae]
MSPMLERQYQPQHEPKRHKKVRERVFKGGITKGEKLVYGLSIPAIVILAFMIISNAASLYALNHDMQVIEADIAAQGASNEALSLQVKELADPERILYIAKEELGMELHDESVKLIHDSN